MSDLFTCIAHRYKAFPKRKVLYPLRRYRTAFFARMLCHMKNTSISLALSFSLVAFGCASAVDEDSSVASESDAIVGGRATTALDAVGALTLQGQAFCTGTLVGKRTVVTAAHCLESTPARLIRFAIGQNASRPTLSIPAASATVHPQYDGASITNDIGVVILASDAPVEAIAPSTQALTPASVGQTLFFLGYGITSGATQGGAGIKRYVTMPIRQVGGTQFSYGEPGKNTCNGDSGGPALARAANGSFSLVGVTSFGDQGCVQFGVDTRVDTYMDFVRAVSPDL
jgi:secreted trypsin-like serine protease